VMHLGAKVAWTQRFNSDEISALQNAINIKLDRGPAAFEAEYQNSPLKPQNLDEQQLEPHIIAAKLSRLPRGVVPMSATRITAFVDVMDKALYWVVCAFDPDFSGYVLDYGTFPDQGRAYFTLADVKNTLQMQFPGTSVEGWLHAGLDRLTTGLLTREWAVDGGHTVRTSTVIVDSGYKPQVVHAVVSQSPFRSLIVPSKGVGITALQAPMENWAKRGAETRSKFWIKAKTRDYADPIVSFDSNYWKTFVSSRLNTAIGDRGSLCFFGATPEPHKMICDHICAETRIIDEARGRRVEVWQPKMNEDNHWFDCVVGCHVGASMGGIDLREHQEKKRHDGPRPSLGDLRKKAHAG